MSLSLPQTAVGEANQNNTPSIPVVNSQGRSLQRRIRNKTSGSHKIISGAIIDVVLFDGILMSTCSDFTKNAFVIVIGGTKNLGPQI